MSTIHWALLSLGADVLIGSALIYVLLRRDYTAGGTVEWAIAHRRRRRWIAALVVAALAYAALAPVSLAALIRVIRSQPRRRVVLVEPPSSRHLFFLQRSASGADNRSDCGSHRPCLGAFAGRELEAPG